MEPLTSPLLRAAASSLHRPQCNSSERPLFPKIDSPRTASYTTVSAPVSCTRPHDARAHPPMERVPMQRVYGSSTSYLEPSSSHAHDRPHHALSKPHPPTTPRQQPQLGSSNHTAESAPPNSLQNEFLVLHPSLDLTDENGELSQLLLSKWSLDEGEQSFNSVSLFCEMKLSEARRMTSWVERPNRFFATVCCQLLNKYVQRLEAQRLNPESGASAAFLRKIHDELVPAIFMSAPSAQPEAYEGCVPYFLEYKKLRRRAQLLIANVENRTHSAALKARLPGNIEKVLITREHHADKQLLGMLFRLWRRTARQEAEVRTLKCRAFLASRKLNISALFRAWRIEALRRAYQRESVEYQTMLSITAASLSRKDVQIVEGDRKMASMAKIIDSLTESNAQLLYRVEQLEAIAAGKGGGALATLHGAAGGVMLGFHRSQGAHYDSIDTLESRDSGGIPANVEDEKTDRTNRMLLETLFGMARMVESCAIQMSKDMMDSLEHQLDGALLQQLAEMIHADNVAKIKADEARGLSVGQYGGLSSAPSTPSAQLQRARTPFQNATMMASLGKGTVAIKDLGFMPVDAFLLNWFRMNLQTCSAAEKSSDRTIKNFTSDLVDGRRFSFLLHRLFPAWFDANMVHEIDADERLKNVAQFHKRIQPELPQVVTSDSIHSGGATENVAFTAMLFGVSVQTIRRINMDKQREKFLNVITSWKRVRSLLLEVKRMNDNYDQLMVVHLLKEMRTCETLFKQLNAELCSVAIASNESSSTMAQIAYKLLQFTWRCLHAKAAPGGEAKLEFVDERLAERVKDFAHVELPTVRQLLVNDSQYEASALGSLRKASAMMPPRTPHVIPEKEVAIRTDAVRSTLAVYCKDLHDIFKHYSASGGAGSIASMSMSEFLKLMRDCELVAGEPAAVAPAPTSKRHATAAATAASVRPTVPQSAIEFVYRASLFFSPLTPRDVVSSALSTSSEPTASTSSRSDPPSSPLQPSSDPFRPDQIIMSLDFGEREMVGHEFADALLRMAAILKVPPCGVALDDRLRDLMELHVLPNALRSQAEIFRAEVASPKVRAVFQKHKQALQRVFKYYTSMHALREQQSTMDLKEFTVFARDCKLIGSFVTEHTLKQVLVNLQHGDGDTSSTQGDDASVLRVDFADFQEAVAALTEYVICNPYVPLYKRIEQFIHENVLPRAKQKKKGVGEV